MEICTPGTSSHENNYNREQNNRKIPIKHLKTENCSNMKLRKRKYPIKEDNSTEELSSEDNFSGEPNIKRISPKGRTLFPTVPLDLLSKIPCEDKEKLEKFEENAKYIEELFEEILKSNETEYNPRIFKKNEEPRKIIMRRMCDLQFIEDVRDQNNTDS